MTNNILEIHNLSKDYGDFVLDRISFSLPRGVIMGLIGENGAGKSTTINCILNEIQKDSGEILILGKDHISDEMEIKSKLGIVFDENHFRIFLPLRKLENICLVFIQIGNGLLIANILKSLNCQKIRKSKTFLKE